MTREQRLRNDYKKVFNPKDPSVARVMADLSKLCWYNDPVYAPGDALSTAYRDGARGVFLYIKRTRNLTDEDIEKMSHDAKLGDIE